MSLTFEPSKQVEREYFSKLHDDFMTGFHDYLRMQRPFPYVKASVLMKELGISQTYLSKLEAHGLKRVILEDGDKFVWYSYKQLAELMDKLAV